MKLTVQPYKDGFGITNGMLWFAWYYSTETMAAYVLANLCNSNEDVIKANVNRDEPIERYLPW